MEIVVYSSPSHQINPIIAAIIAAIQYHSKSPNIKFTPPHKISFLSFIYYSNLKFRKQVLNEKTYFILLIFINYDAESFSFFAFSIIS